MLTALTTSVYAAIGGTPAAQDNERKRNRCCNIKIPSLLMPENRLLLQYDLERVRIKDDCESKTHFLYLPLGVGDSGIVGVRELPGSSGLIMTTELCILYTGSGLLRWVAIFVCD